MTAYTGQELLDTLNDKGLADWQARAADAFHRQATQWAGEVSGLVCLAETARLSAARARDAAQWRSEVGL